MNVPKLFFLLTFAVPGLSGSETQADHYSALAKTCTSAQEPGACMESYGFKCHRSRLPSRSLEAYVLGCNLELSDGRYHFVQMLYDNGGWNIERQETYAPEPAEDDDFAEDSGSALSTYVRAEMRNYTMYSGGSVPSDYVAGPLRFETGTRKHGEHIILRAVCGVVLDGPLDEDVSMGTKSECEKRLLRAVKTLSQPQATGPYRAAGAAEFEWTSKTVTLVSGDLALVSEGRYTFAPKHTPCRWISDCCSGDGPIYLESCRIPTEVELQAVKSCLAQELRLQSEVYFDCLRDADVRVGCNEQADGSRTCY